MIGFILTDGPEKLNILALISEYLDKGSMHGGKEDHEETCVWVISTQRQKHHPFEPRDRGRRCGHRLSHALQLERQ